jgi:hypothetical protein
VGEGGEKKGGEGKGREEGGGGRGRGEEGPVYKDMSSIFFVKGVDFAK